MFFGFAGLEHVVCWPELILVQIGYL